MQTEFCTSGILPAFSTHFERSIASDTKFKFTLKKWCVVNKDLFLATLPVNR